MSQKWHRLTAAQQLARLTGSLAEQLGVQGRVLLHQGGQKATIASQVAILIAYAIGKPVERLINDFIPPNMGHDINAIKLATRNKINKVIEDSKQIIIEARPLYGEQLKSVFDLLEQALDEKVQEHAESKSP